MTAVAGQELNGLRSRLSGRVVTAADDYDRAGAVGNGAIDRRPAVIARCAGPGAVAAAGFAPQASLEISVRGGARNFGAAAAGDAGLTADPGTVCQVLADPQARPARAKPTQSRSARHCLPVTCRDTAGTPPAHRPLAW